MGYVANKSIGSPSWRDPNVIDVVQRHGAVANATWDAATGIWSGTDNTAAFQAAFDAAFDDGLETPNKPVYIPAGFYMVKSLTIKKGLVVTGAGWRGTRLIANDHLTYDNKDAIIQIADPAESAEGEFLIQGLCLDGNAALYNACLIGNNQATGTSSGAFSAIENCMFVNSSQHALFTYNPDSNPIGGLNGLLVTNCRFNGGSLGFVNLQVDNQVHFHNCYFEQGGVALGLPYALKIAPLSTTKGIHSSTKITSCWFEFSADGNWQETNPPQWGVGHADNGSVVSKVVTMIDIDAAAHVAISDCRMSAVQADDDLFEDHIRIRDKASRITMDNIQFREYGKAGVAVFIADDNDGTDTQNCGEISITNCSNSNTSKHGQDPLIRAIKNNTTQNFTISRRKNSLTASATGAPTVTYPGAFARGQFYPNADTTVNAPTGWWASSTSSGNGTAVVWGGISAWATTTYNEFDLVTANGGTYVYMCIVTDGDPAANSPTHNDNTRPVEADGYSWLYMGRTANWTESGVLYT